MPLCCNRIGVLQALADRAALRTLADEHLTVPTDKGANAGLKVASLVAGMVAGADSIDDMALLRHGGMSRLFAKAYAPSTLGSFLRAFTFGHVRQLDAIASRFLVRLAEQAPLLAASDRPVDRVTVDVDDTIIEVHGYAKQGSGYGYSGVRGLNALLATVTTTGCAPVVVAQRLRKGSCGSPRGAKRLIADALKTTASLTTAKPLVRADSAFYGAEAVNAALGAGADVSVTVRLDPKVKAAIAAIDADAWTPIEYTDAVYDEDTDTWISRAEVAEVPFTAFTSKKKSHQVTGRLVVRRIPDLNPSSRHGQPTLFDTWRFHAFLTTTDHEMADTVAADKTHRGHAIIEQVHADLKNSALAHLPSVIWSGSAGVHDVRDEGCVSCGVRRGRGYLQSSITAAEGTRCGFNVWSCRGSGRVLDGARRRPCPGRAGRAVPGLLVLDRAVAEHGQGVRARPEGLVHLPGRQRPGLAVGHARGRRRVRRVAAAAAGCP